MTKLYHPYQNVLFVEQSSSRVPFRRLSYSVTNEGRTGLPSHSVDVEPGSLQIITLLFGQGRRLLSVHYLHGPYNERPRIVCVPETKLVAPYLHRYLPT